MPNLTINGRPLEAAADQTILDVARAAGIDIPTLCWYPTLPIVGNCRICLVSVEGQLDLAYVPFKDLVNPQSLKTEVRFIRQHSDYHRLARFLETRTDKIVDWSPGRRSEG